MTAQQSAAASSSDTSFFINKPPAKFESAISNICGGWAKYENPGGKPWETLVAEAYRQAGIYLYVLKRGGGSFLEKNRPPFAIPIRKACV
jgi:hypothetical protein